MSIVAGIIYIYLSFGGLTFYMIYRNFSRDRDVFIDSTIPEKITIIAATLICWPMILCDEKLP